MYTAGTAILDALWENGVSHLFANLGSDHPAFIESLAQANATGRPAPRLITCPNEMVALSAAQGFAQVSGRAQTVLVHVDCGTLSLGGAVHNAAKGRVPVLIFAGESPMTQHGEMRGSRNEFIHWIQDVFDQRGIVRGYVKYNGEIRTGTNAKQMVHRALQFACSDPKGPVYLTAAREVLEQETPQTSNETASYALIGRSAIPPSDIMAVTNELISARRPLIVTTYLGRDPAAIEELTRLCRSAAIGLLESVPTHFNFPADDPMYLGSQVNEPQQNPVLADADVILLLDTDVPWIPTVNKPSDHARISHIDVDPLKEQMPLWHVPATRVFRADSATALRQMNEYLASKVLDSAVIQERRCHYAQLHESHCKKLDTEQQPRTDAITPEYLTATVRQFSDDQTIFLNEGITNYKAITDHLRVSRPGSLFTSGGGSLGWNGGAAIGMKLACPEKTVVCLTGDGSYLFSQPSTVHWMARRYKTPFLQVIYNNGGWKSPKLSMLAVHPDAYASRARDIGVSFDPPPDYPGIATAAGGAYGCTVRESVNLEPVLKEAFKAVRDDGRCAVVDVSLPRL